MALARILNQHLNQNPAAEQIGALLSDGEIRRIRVLVAFCKGAGVGLLANDLQGFISGGGSAECIIGLDLGGTSPDALQSLLGLGVSVHVFGVQGHRTFHPKVCICDDGAGRSYAVFVGSSNWTQGGLETNFEAGVVVEAQRGASTEDDEFISEVEALWATYRNPSAPLKPGNLRKVTPQLVVRLGERAAREDEPAPDELRSTPADEMFPPISVSAPLRKRARVRGSRRPPTPSVTSLPRHLYLDVRGPETGQGREIQVPLDSLRDFFGIERDDAYFMTFAHADGTVEVNRPLARYGNSTFRLSSGTFRELDRPTIVHLERVLDVDAAYFRVRAYQPGTSSYNSAERRLNRHSRGKDWGIR